MPTEEEQHQYTVDLERGLVLARLRGRVTLESLLKLADRVYADESCQPEFDSIFDIQTTDWAVDFTDIHEYTQHISANPRMLRGRLVIVTPTPVAFGIGRMYQAIHDSFPSDMHFEPTVEAAMKALYPSDE